MNEEEKMNAIADSTTPDGQNPLIPPESEMPTEEPVMIAANIDEMTEEEIAAITTSAPTPTNDIPMAEAPSTVEVTPPETTPVEEPVEPNTEVVIPANAPDLGGSVSANEESSVSSFQQLTTTDAPPVAETTPMVEQSFMPPITQETNLTDLYQAKPDSESSFQLDPKESNASMQASDSDEETIITDEYDEEEFEETPPKKKKLLPFIIIVIFVLVAAGVGAFVLRPKKAGTIEMLRPERTANSNMNIVILGDVDTPNAELVSAITKKYGTETKKEEVEKCSEISANSIKFNLNVYEIKTESNKTYNINYPCDYDSAIRYMFSSEGDKTVDGAILVISSKEGVNSQITEYVKTLKNLSINRMVVYITRDADSTKAEADITALLEKEGFDSKNTPIILGNLVDEQIIPTIITKAGNWIEKEASYRKPSVVTEYNAFSLYTIFLKKEEGGLQTELKGKAKDNLTLMINGEDYKGTIKLETGQKSISPGQMQTLKVELKDGLPMVNKMRIIVKQDNTIIGIGVISELG